MSLRRRRLAQEIVELRARLRVLEQIAQCDELTGLYRRWYFLERVTTVLREISLGERRAEHEQYAFILLDVVEFSQFNEDEEGQVAGDAILQEVATTLKGFLRTYDTLGRLGGDEFAFFVRISEKDVDERIAQINASLREIDSRLAVHWSCIFWDKEKDPNDLYRAAAIQLREKKLSKKK